MRHRRRPQPAGQRASANAAAGNAAPVRGGAASWPPPSWRPVSTSGCCACDATTRPAPWPRSRRWRAPTPTIPTCPWCAPTPTGASATRPPHGQSPGSGVPAPGGRRRLAAARPGPHGRPRCARRARRLLPREVAGRSPGARPLPPLADQEPRRQRIRRSRSRLASAKSGWSCRTFCSRVRAPFRSPLSIAISAQP